MEYNPRVIERKWRENWEQDKLYEVSNTSEKPKFYVLDMFPYPSGAGLHVGHPLGYIASDIFSRYKRLKGFHVLHPMGYDAFGLPAEQYAIQTGVHPAISTAENIARYRSQLENLGLSFDWSREVSTASPDFYKWTQWIFIQLFEHYYDLEADKALPIADLVQRFSTSGNAGVRAASNQEQVFSAADWAALTPVQQEDILMNYRLAYRKVTFVNWCEALGTVLANDEVKDGVSERGGHPVARKPMLQWSLRITAYAERLLNDLQNLEWSEAMKKMQSNWIGKSIGAQVFFPIKDSTEKIEIFTTRPDTIFGATFMVLAPEHDLVAHLTTPAQQAEVAAYLDYVKTRSDRDRMAEVQEVTGAFLGAYAVHPFSGEAIPIWIGEYVLKDYGTGAIMAVPSDDDRDYAFAKKFDLPVIPVVDKTDYPGASRQEKVGKMINSGMLDGMEVADAIEHILTAVEERGLGHRKVNYKLRDAIFSRQRYWGEPFPIVYDAAGIPQALPLEALPLTLPDLDDFQPASGGKSPLARAEDWVNQSGGFTRETDTMPGFAGSSWYFLRYMDAHNPDAFAGPEAIDYWRDVDLYVGGTEHAVGHLMYSRFWHKFLYDKGLVPTPEPFRKLINQGMIQGVIEYINLQKEKVNGVNRFVCAGIAAKEQEAGKEFVKIPIHVDFVKDYGTDRSFLNTDSLDQFREWRSEYRDAIFECTNGVYQSGKFHPHPEKDGSGSHLLTSSEVGKMSKRYFNVVNPDDVVEKYGADCFRMYEMFLGPIEQAKPWDTKGIDGVSKFLRKFWGLFFNEAGTFELSDEAPAREELKVLHTAIRKISEDIERFAFNTCVSAFMVATNELKKSGCRKRAVLSDMVVMIAPFAPYMAEELWQLMGRQGSVHESTFPQFNPAYLVEDMLDYPVSINGKRRANVAIPADADDAFIERAVMELEEVRKWVEDKPVKKVIIVPKRMVNIVL
ncbi:MAG: leucine--tRNA ligase [Saprospiraceae bacterium]|nr:leucine--tRNA ligase [Saprospiraceae bacterium]